MKQLGSLFLCAAILALFLTGCRAEPVLEDAQKPAVSKDTLEQTATERVLTLCALAFGSSDAETALDEAGCAVLYGYETYPSYYLETPEPLLSFWEQAQAGQDCAIELVRLKDTHTLSYQKLSVENGKPYAQFLRCAQYADGSVAASNFERFAVQDWQMTDTGNFYYRLFPAGDKHYADYQLVRTVPPDTSRLSMLEQYVLPIDYYYVNLLITDWSEPDFAGVSFNDLFDRLYALHLGSQPDASDYTQDEKTGVFRIPSADFERVILPYFSISAEKLRALAGYDEQTDTYPWRPVRTNDMELYDYPAVEPYITDVRENPDGTMTLLLSCLSTDIPTDCIFSHELTVRTLPSGGFEYVSNHITYQTELGLPNAAPRLSVK